MSTTVCLNNYEYNGQVYSPAFSDPPSPKDYNPDSEEDVEDPCLSPPASPKSYNGSYNSTINSYKIKKGSPTILKSKINNVPSTRYLEK